MMQEFAPFKSLFGLNSAMAFLGAGWGVKVREGKQQSAADNGQGLSVFFYLKKTNRRKRLCVSFPVFRLTGAYIFLDQLQVQWFIVALRPQRPY